MDKGTQGRRFSTASCWSEGWETANVGGAYLFEKPQSRARRIPRFSDIIGDNNNSAYDADCDSSAYNAMRS